MQSVARFREVVARVRAGDQTAAAELVNAYEPEVRRLIRVKLTDPNLRRSVDSADISQSVLGHFFVRVAAGQFDLDEPDDLIKLLTTMVKHKILDHARKPAHRDTRSGDSAVWATAADGGKTPSGVVAEAELIAEIRRRMTDDERRIAEQRCTGASWQEVAEAVGTTRDAVRKRFERALDRICGDLGIDRVADA